MRLDPVYLVAPKKKPPSIPTRRAFLIAGGTFLAGAAAGSACGYSSGSANVGANKSVLPPPSGDAELDELRRLALEAPIKELAGRWLYFGTAFSRHYRHDKYLPKGIDSIIDHLVANPEFDRRLIAAQYMRDIINNGEPKFRKNMEDRLMDLSTIR
jgi:hypothetical protein